MKSFGYYLVAVFKEGGLGRKSRSGVLVIIIEVYPGSQQDFEELAESRDWKRRKSPSGVPYYRGNLGDSQDNMKAFIVVDCPELAQSSVPLATN